MSESRRDALELDAVRNSRNMLPSPTVSRQLEILRHELEHSELEHVWTDVRVLAFDALDASEYDDDALPSDHAFQPWQSTVHRYHSPVYYFSLPMNRDAGAASAIATRREVVGQYIRRVSLALTIVAAATGLVAGAAVALDGWILPPLAAIFLPLATCGLALTVYKLGGSSHQTHQRMGLDP